MTVLLADGRNLADITELISAPQLDYRVGQVSEMTIPAVDPGNVSFPTLLKAGAKLTYDGAVWDVAAVERDYRGEGVVLSFTARSQLARRLRLRTGPDSGGKITPADWITQKVREEGGRALVQPGATRRKIVQKREESVLDVIGNLSGEMATEWVEWGNRLFVGTGWWALQGNPGLPTWPLGIRSEDCLGFQSRSSLDDKTQAATANVTLPYAYGIKVRPWHRMQIKGASSDDNGIWLVQDVSYTLHKSSTATVTLYRPLKSQVQKQGSASSGRPGDESMLTLDGDWIEGADKVWRNCTRTPRQYVNWALGQKGSYWRQNGCLAWVSIAVSGVEGRGGLLARYTWERRPAGTPTTQSRTPPIGAIVVWDGSHGGGAGHVGISLGGGRFISATGGSVRIDPISGGWASGYYGAMAPAFYV